MTEPTGRDFRPFLRALVERAERDYATRKRRADAGMSRREWRDHKRRSSTAAIRELRKRRSQADIRREAAAMLAEQFRAQRERWGFV